MPYTTTVDERFGGTFLSAPAGFRDAPGIINLSYYLAPGTIFKAYGTSVPYLNVADIDVYSLGVLPSGIYSVKASGNNWDLTNSVFGFSNPIVEVFDAQGLSVGADLAPENRIPC